MINDKHLELLNESGIDKKLATEFGGIRSLSKKEVAGEFNVESAGIGFTYYNVDGDEIGRRVKLENPTATCKYIQKEGTSLTLYFSTKNIGQIKDVTTPLGITEGEKKCIKLQSCVEFPCISIPGCWNWKEAKKEGLSKAFNKIPLKGRVINLFPDTDFFSSKQVKGGYEGFIRALIDQGAIVNLIDFRKKGRKIGIDTYIMENPNGVDDLIASPLWIFKKHASDTTSKLKDILRESVLLDLFDVTESIGKKIGNHSRTEIKTQFKKQQAIWEKNFFFDKKITPNPLHRGYTWVKSGADSIPVNEVVDSVIFPTLNRSPNFYVESLSQKICVKVNSSLRQIERGSDLSEYLSRELPFKEGKINNKGFYVDTVGQRTVPTSICSVALKYENPPVKSINLVTGVPVLANKDDLKLIDKAGYHQDEKILYEGKHYKPSYSTKYLREALSFPYARDNGFVDALGTLVGSMFLRDAFLGDHPGVIVQGDGPNLGKTKFTKTLSHIISGERPATTDFTYNEEELTKRISTFIPNATSIVLDNCKGNKPINSAFLERVMTDTLIETRLLGTNTNIVRRNNVIFMLTLNGGDLSPDLVTRCIPIILSHEKAKAFPKDSEEFAIKHRDEIICELLGLVKTWIKKGRPYEAVKFGKFAKWAGVVNGILKANNISGFVEAYSEITASLDTIKTSLLTVGSKELGSEAKSSTYWTTKLNNLDINILSEYPTEKSKSTTVGNNLKVMVGQKHKYGEIEIIVRKERKRKQNLYFFESSTTKNIEDEVEESESKKKEDVPPTIVNPNYDESWDSEMPSNVHYKLHNEEYKSKWWEGEDIGEKFSFDLETSIITDGATPEPALGSAFNGKTLYFLEPSDLKQFYKKHKDSTFICQNAAFDLNVLEEHLGEKNLATKMVLAGKVNDTQYLGRLINLATKGDTQRYPYGLSKLSEEHLGVVLPKDVQVDGRCVRTSYGSYTGGLIKSAVSAYFHYNAFDTIATYFLWDVLRKKSTLLSAKHNVDDSKNLSHDIQVGNSVAAYKLTKLGFQVDSKKVNDNIAYLQKLIGEIDEWMLEKYDYFSGKGEKIRFNAAMEQVEREHGIKFDRELNGVTKTLLIPQRKEFLNQYRHIELVEKFLSRTHLNKILRMCEKLEGKDRVHPKISTLKNTGRNGMREPNLQQTPRDTSIVDLRSQLISKEGHTLYIADYSSAELVVLAQTCVDRYGSSVLGEYLNQKKDVHRDIAAKFLGKDPTEITKEERVFGKVANFSLPAGTSAKTLVATAKSDYGVEITEDEAEEIKKHWFSTYPEMKKYLNESSKEYEKLIKVPHPNGSSKMYAAHNFLGIIAGYTETAGGREYTEDEIAWAWDNADELAAKNPLFKKFVPDIRRRFASEALVQAFKNSLVSIVKSGRIRAACSYTVYNNNPFQAGLSDISNDAFLNLTHAGYRVVCIIHDEFVIEVPNENKDYHAEKINSIMINSAKKFCPDVAMSVEGEFSNHWKK